ncbi:MAG TPA: DUF3616 domain-containing protein [Geminicoccaceae bacterium]
MAHQMAKVKRRVRLSFLEPDEIGHADEAPRGDLSAATSSGRCLWTSNDEFSGVERLVAADGGAFGRHQGFSLGDIFDLPEGPGEEMDIEGLDVDGGYLWVVGSHSLTREKPKPGEHDPEAALERLTDIDFHANRHFLGRVPLVETAAGVFDLAAEIEADGTTMRRAACLKMGKKGGKLARLLGDDEHIGRFMSVPAKENGFDIEGIAVKGDRVFLGLRGPVLRGWAMLIELEVKEAKPGRLKPRKLAAAGRRYAKHLLDLGGLGIRELEFDGDALLILAGPTMDLDGPVALYRWPGCLEALEQTVVSRGSLELVSLLPYGCGTDHPEGMCWIDAPDGARELLVIYDSPADDRLHDDGRSIDADAFGWPDPAAGPGATAAEARSSRPSTGSRSGRTQG